MVELYRFYVILANFFNSSIVYLLQEKKRMRGEIVDKSLMFLVRLKSIRLPSDFTETLLAILEWGSERVVVVSCLTIMKYNIPRTHVQVRIIS